jgi:hypothetical protein
MKIHGLGHRSSQQVKVVTANSDVRKVLDGNWDKMVSLTAHTQC